MQISFILFAALALAASIVQGQTFVYKFNPKQAAGIDGGIVVQYDSPHSTKATISAALDFSKVDKDAIVKSDGNCTGVDVTEYKWHIHVKWSSKKASESFAQCGKPLTGNHYDPLTACGPFSEFIDTPECVAKIAKAPYMCTPDSYKWNPMVCEKGDLSGKVGNFKPDMHGKVHTMWVDKHYPMVGENTPEWNIILHAVCGKATPRVACALGKQVKYVPRNGGKNRGNDAGNAYNGTVNGGQ